MDRKQLEKDLRNMTGDQIFELYSVTEKRVRRYEDLLKYDKERLKLLADVIYHGKQIEKDYDYDNENRPEDSATTE
jgi:hypothetical protein